MRDWIREASEGVIWIVPGADLEDIVMSLVPFFFFFLVKVFLCIVQTGMWFSFSMIPSLSTVRELYFFFKSKDVFFPLIDFSNQNHIG